MSQTPRPESPGASHGHTGDYTGVPANALPLTATEDRQWATMAHFGGILGCIPSLVIYLVFRERGPFTAQESHEALNFTVPPTVVAVVCNVLALIPVVGWVFALIAAAIWLGVTVFSVIAGVHANRGQPYRYPVNLHLVRH
ncbi:DUF4870 domain-containing protein [Tersicoccus sp. Bi-70]|uniref:DUF4870 domain-containing protein n=1 Tax=Tersicoccus sp. Bi-70 TaxID=1897634 RepID=UPI0009775B27|nr:DUF4870 domain-containing protein [Tersicoccus sp. Bi-70]OMH37052.1 hypothetical protein BGP79_15270 [Tersicoccus sp. Bi-70]